MIAGIKALIVVLVIGTVVFRFGKPIAILFSSEADFCRRRNVWFVLTAAAFLSPNFWLFALIAAPLVAWAGRRDTNPLALYLILLHVIPPIPVDIPVIVIKQLFTLDNFRLLSLFLLVPAAWRLKKLQNTTRIRGLTAIDLSILAYGLLQLLYYVPPDLPDHTILEDSATNVLRRGFLFFIDIYIVYFVVSRSCCTRRALTETLSAFCMASALMASVAVFETLKGWWLYSDISQRWGSHLIYGSQYGVYFFREGFLRAEASAGHALALGFFLAIAFGFWMYLKLHVKSAFWRVAVGMLLWLGLLASQARGSILGAIVIYFAFSVLGPRALPRLVKAIAIVTLVVGMGSVTPFGQRLLNSMPIFGQSTDRASVDYRQRLAERSWELIQLNPFFGDRLVMTKMEDLRQGEGIIDFVNTYAQVTLFYGSIGLATFLAAIVLALFNAYRESRDISRRDPNYSLLGVSLVACLLGTLFIIASTSLAFGSEAILYILAGLAAAYAHLNKLPERG